MLELGILKTWNAETHKAGVQLVGSLTTYLDNISVATNIAPQAMVVGNYVLVAIPGGNPRDACVVASWPQGSSGGGGGGGGGAFYALADATCIWRAWGHRVSTTPRTATVSSVAGDVITLTAAESYRFGEWGSSPEYMHKDNVKVKIRNNTRAQFAWVINGYHGLASNKLQVDDAADISTWQNGDTITTSYSGASHVGVELDLSGVILAGATIVFFKAQCSDNGTISTGKGVHISKAAVAGTWSMVFPQVSGIQNVAYPSIANTEARHVIVKDRATGVDTLQHAVYAIAYVK